MKIIFSLLFILSINASEYTWVDRTISKNGLDFCLGESQDRAFRVVLKDNSGNFLEPKDMYMQVWQFNSDTVETFNYVREVFNGRAYRNAEGAEVQATSPNHVNNTSFSFINPDGTQGLRDNSPYLPWRPSCGEYVKN